MRREQLGIAGLCFAGIGISAIATYELIRNSDQLANRLADDFAVDLIVYHAAGDSTLACSTLYPASTRYIRITYRESDGAITMQPFATIPKERP